MPRVGPYKGKERKREREEGRKEGRKDGRTEGREREKEGKKRTRGSVDGAGRPSPPPGRQLPLLPEAAAARGHQTAPPW